MKMTGSRKDAAGFTLVEMLVVICVITILIGLMANAAFSARQKSFKAVATQECEQIAAAFKSYWLAKNKWPIAETDWADLDAGKLNALLGKDPAEKDKTIYLSLDDKNFESDGKYVDPWGNPYRIKIEKNNEVEVEERFEAVVSFPNQFSRYYGVSAPYVK